MQDCKSWSKEKVLGWKRRDVFTAEKGEGLLNVL